MTDLPPVLQLSGVTKAFGAVTAVDGIDLDVPAGSFFGLVGPNGAGKTTTLRMATGLLRPDAGRIVVDGIDVWMSWASSLDAKRRVGVLPEDLALFERLTGRQLLTYVGLLREIPPAQVDERAETLLQVLGLDGSAGTLVVDYSHGMRKKVALAAALLHGPRVLFLDEPFEAIDPVSARTIRAVLARHREAGGTVIFSSHVMELVERLCDHVAVLHRGRIVASGALDDVRAGASLEDAFVRLVGAAVPGDGRGDGETPGTVRGEGEWLGWLGSSSG